LPLRFTLLVLSISAATAFAALGRVVSSFPAPAPAPAALARSTDHLYVFCSTPVYIYKVDPASGSVLASYPAPFGMYTKGLDYRYGGYLWLGSYDVDYVYQCGEASGSVYASWPLRYNLDGGLACEGDQSQPGLPRAVLFSSHYPPAVWRQNLAGSLLSTFATAERLAGLAWDYHNELLWGCEDGTEDRVVGYGLGGALAASFRAPAAPAGLAYLGEYLWISGGNDFIWQVECPGDVALEPASVGKVKALFY
jgi:hypothetical protein